MIVQILKFKHLKWKALLVSFQPGFTVTPGRSSIQQTAAVSSVASRTPPMREWKTAFFLNCLQWNNYVVQFVCQHYVVIFTWTIAIVYHSVHWDDSWLILASFLAQHTVSVSTSMLADKTLHSNGLLDLSNLTPLFCLHLLSSQKQSHIILLQHAEMCQSCSFN